MADYLSFKNVGVSRTSVWEAHRGRIVEQLVRAEILRCELEFGSPEQRPTVSAVVGSVLLVPGAVFAQHMFLLITEGKSANLRYEAAMLTFGGLGAWLVFEAIFRRQFYLRIVTRERSRKLVFATNSKLVEIREFLVQANREFGLSSEDKLTEKKPNRLPQYNAGSRPSSGDSSASETPSSLGPRG